VGVVLYLEVILKREMKKINGKAFRDMSVQCADGRAKIRIVGV
jgi:hypothetical protein